MHKLIACAALAAASLGSIHVASAAPAWCSGARFDDELDLQRLSDSDPRVVIVTFAHAACAPSGEAAARKAELEQSRAAWGKRLGMIEADWADVIAFAAEHHGSARPDLAFSTKDLASLTPLDQLKAIVDGFRVPDGHRGTTAFVDPRYVADLLEPHLSEVGRYGYVAGCIATKEASVAAWATCQGDLDKLDLPRLFEELRKDTAHPGDVRQALRFELFDLAARMKAHAARVKEAVGKDPVYGKMFEVAARARAEWAAGPAANAALVDLAFRLDAGTITGSRKLLEGCEATTAAALAAEVAKLPAASFKKLHDARYDPSKGFADGAAPLLGQAPSVSLAAMPYILCQRKSGTAQLLAASLHDTIGFRGPRTAALTRLYGEKFVLDERDAKVTWPATTATPLWSGSREVQSAGGVVASAKLDGDLLIVKLTKLMVKHEECARSHKTGRISEVLINGAIVYETICDQAKTVTEDEQWDDFKVDKKYAPLLKPGVRFSAVSPSGDGTRGLGMDVIAIWPAKAAEAPSWLLGAVIK
jgi:hypothetical protein